MAKQYISNGCDTLNDKTNKCEKVCSLCTQIPPCNKEQTRNYSTCNRRFLSEKCFKDLLTLKAKGKLVCQRRQVWRNCSNSVSADSKHECIKKFCNFCNKHQHSGHFCYGLHWNLASCSTSFCTFSSIWSAHKTFKSVMGLSSMFRTSYVLSKLVKIRSRGWYVCRLWTVW